MSTYKLVKSLDADLFGGVNVSVISPTLAVEEGGNLELARQPLKDFHPGPAMVDEVPVRSTLHMPENMPLRLGLCPGMVRRFCTGDGVVHTVKSTFGAGMLSGEHIEFDRSAPLLSVASTSALDDWYITISAANDMLNWTTGVTPFSVSMAGFVPFNPIPMLFYVAVVKATMGAFDPTIIDVQFDLINSTGTGGKVLLVSNGTGGTLQLSPGSGWAEMGFLGTESTPGGALFATNVPPGGGMGARAVLMSYITTTGEQLQTIVPLNGTTPVQVLSSAGVPVGGQSINFMGVTHAGILEENQGKIYAGLSPPVDLWAGGKPTGALWMVIDVARGVSAVAHFMIPKGKTSHVVKLIISTDSAHKTDNVMFSTHTHQTLFGYSVVRRSAISIALIHNVHIDSHSLPGFEENWVFQIEAVAVSAGINATLNIHMVDVDDIILPTPPPFA